MEIWRIQVKKPYNPYSEILIYWIRSEHRVLKNGAILKPSYFTLRSDLKLSWEYVLSIAIRKVKKN